jgi:hypothetical protein
MIENNDIVSQFIDWRYIVLYYSALHFGDAYLAKKGITNIVNHTDRHKKYHKNLPVDIYIAYKRLESRSMIARYIPELSNVLTISDFKDLYTDDFLKLKSLV